MTCDITYEQLAAYNQADLPPDRHQVVDRHVPSCPTCQHRLATLRTLDAALQHLPAETPPAETILAARRFISAEIRPPRESEILTLDEVADYLRIDPQDLGPYVEDLPAFELGGQIRVRRSRLLEWIEQRERQFNRGGAPIAITRFRPVEPWKGVAL